MTHAHEAGSVDADAGLHRDQGEKDPERTLAEPSGRKTPYGRPYGANDGLRGALGVFRGGIGLRLLTLTILFSASVTLIATAVQSIASYQSDIATIKTRLDEIGRSQHDVIAESLWNVDFDHLQTILNGLIQLPDVQFLQVSTTLDIPERAKIVSVGTPGHGATILRDYRITYTDGTDSRDIGRLHIEATTDNAVNAILERVLENFLTQGVVIFTTSLFLVFLYYQLVARHLRTIAFFLSGRQMDDITAVLNLKRKPGSAPDELDDVVNSLNAMGRRLSEAYGSLSRASARMEEDIAARMKAEEEVTRLNVDLERRVLERTTELAKALDNLRMANDELLRSEKMAALGTLVAGMAHELNTPIGNAVTVSSTLVDEQQRFLRLIQAGLTRSQLSEFIEEVGEIGQTLERNLNRAAELIGNFKQLAVDQSSYQRRTFLLGEVVEEVLLAMGPTLRRCPFSMRVNVSSELRMDSYPGPFGQVLINLINNALVHAFAGHDHGNIHIRATKDNAGDIIVQVEDDGCGIPKKHQKRIFDPFFTTKLNQGSSGLGLHIVFNLVTDLLGGHISVNSEPGRGTTFEIRIPATAPVHVKEGSD